MTFQILFISITLLVLENTMLKFPDTSMTVGSVYVDSGTSFLVNHRHCVPHTIVPSSTFPNHKHHVILLIFYSSDIFIYPTFYIHLNSTSTRTHLGLCKSAAHRTRESCSIYCQSLSIQRDSILIFTVYCFTVNKPSEISII